MTIPARLNHLDASAKAVMPAKLPESSLYAAWFKRPFDIAFVIAIAPILVPLVLILALAVLLTTGGNPFYMQERIGRNGRLYRMWKLRSMVPDADAALARLLAADPALAEEWASKQKLENDPRITGIGRLLRKTSMDELPQFFNVLTGDMSLLGPRPMLPEQRNLYPGTDYYRLRPGISGPWQVSERNATTFADRARFDRAYLSKLTFAKDVSLLVATVRAVLRGTGC